MAHLYLDTALSALTMHVVTNEGVTHSFAATEHRASDRLHTELENLLGKAGIQLQQISNLTLVRGPGSFTGVRIAYTIAEALKISLPSLRITAVDTLEAFANSQSQNLPENTDINIVTNAHGGKIFTQKICVENQKVTLKSDVTCIDAANMDSQNILADSSLPVDGAGRTVVRPQAPLLTPQGMAKSIQHTDYKPLYVKPLTYRKLSDKA